jgi:uncharacterized membrane protein YjjB (DUF3815 family)
MEINGLHLLHHAFFGGIAAAGFGILFNFGLRDIPWCLASGAIALGIRTLGLDAGWSLEVASFVAAGGTTACSVRFFRRRLGTTGSTVALTGCIPMVPGAFFAQALLGLFAISAPNAVQTEMTAMMSAQYLLRVIFTVCAIGAGIAIPTHILRSRDF